jgi:hypothetical protein
MTVRISNLPIGQGVGRAAFYRRAAPTVISAANYALTAGDDGRVLVMERETTQVVTVPAGLPAGFGVTVIQGGAATDPDRLIIEGVIGESTLRAQHRVSSAVWSGGPGSQISITRLAADLYSVGGDLHVTLSGSGELVAELDVKANVGQAQPIARWSYANAAARDAASYVSGDIGYVARVESPLGFFRLASVSPLVWERLTGVLTDADVPADVVEVTSTSRTLALSDRGVYLRWTATGAKTLTVDAATGGQPGEYHVRNAAASGNLTIVASGVTIHAPAGGTLVLEPRMTCTLKRVASGVFDLFGQTKAD